MLGLQVASMLPPHGYGNAFQAAVQTQHIGYNASDSDVSSVTPPADGNAGGAADGSAGGAVGSATRLLLANGRDGAAAPPMNKRGIGFGSCVGGGRRILGLDFRHAGDKACTR